MKKAIPHGAGAGALSGKGGPGVRRAKKPEPRQVDVISVIEEALSEIVQLKDEMSDWQSNLESGCLDQTPKYQEVEDCVNELESIDEPSGMGDIAGSLRSHMMTLQDPTPRKRGYSRAERMAQALAMLSDAKAELEPLIESLENLVSEVDEIISQAESISFPGMY